MTRRRLRPVAPIALSMPRARSLRWAITEKPATDTRPMNTRPSTSTTRTSTAGEIPPDIMLGIATVATAGIPGSDVLILNDVGWTPATRNGGDVGGQPRVAAGQRDLHGGGAERGVVRVLEG